MSKFDNLMEGLRICARYKPCDDCPYHKRSTKPGEDCIAKLHEDAILFIEWARKEIKHEWTEDEPDTPQKATETPQPWTREKILAEAKKNVCGQREQDYGTPENSFLTVANLWTAYHGVEFTPIDVAAMLGLLKIARISRNPKHMDSWVDLAGYAVCGGEIAGEGA